MMSRILFASLMTLALGATPTHAQVAPRNGSLTNCNADDGSCTKTECRTDMFGNQNCSTATLAPPPPPPMPSKRELRRLACEERERERQWEAYCRPVIRVDREGIARYRYARLNCDAGTAHAPWLTEPYEEKCRIEAARQ